jgi:minor extracellular protease Epr
MKKEIICLSFIFLVSAMPVSAKPVIVGFTEQVDLDLIRKYGVTNFTSYTIISAISADLPGKAIEELEKNPKIKYIEDDAEVQIAKKTPQPSQQITWGIERVNALEVWNTTTGENVEIAIIDTGISRKHPELDVMGGVNLIGKKKSNNWKDDNGHGTHVAGIIAARNNDIGVVGVAPDAELYAIKVLNQYGRGYISDVIEGMEWAVQNNISIISMSLGTRSYSQAFEEACSNAYNYGALLVAAAGNSGDGNLSTDDVLYPAKFDSVIAVSAVDSGDIAPPWSADGSGVELAAPGVSIFSTWPKDGYTYKSGTSMAAPFVSGVAALFWSKNPGLTMNEIRDLLQNTALDLGDAGKDNIYGHGLVQAN